MPQKYERLLDFSTGQHMIYHVDGHYSIVYPHYLIVVPTAYELRLYYENDMIALQTLPWPTGIWLPNFKVKVDLSTFFQLENNNPIAFKKADSAVFVERIIKLLIFS